MLAIPHRIRPIATAALAITLLLASGAWGKESPPPAAKGKPEQALRQRGKAIYQETCAACHGDDGQGVEGAHEDPLVGDASVADLAKLIAESMPEDDPAACVGAEA